jgi:hypothetical protein
MNKFLNFEFEFKDLQADGTIEGYASTFGNVDQGLDVVDAGAFKKTLAESKGKVPILADHDPSKQLGWNLDAAEDRRGLWVRGKLDIEHNALARERYSLLKTAMDIGAKPGLSIGYRTIKAEPDSGNPNIRRLKELKLYEYSLVTFPMNTEAMVTAAKAWAEGAKDVDEVVAQVLAAVAQFGYSEKQVVDALARRAAPKQNDPDPAVQSMLTRLSAFEKIFKS